MILLSSFSSSSSWKCEVTSYRVSFGNTTKCSVLLSHSIIEWFWWHIDWYNHLSPIECLRTSHIAHSFIHPLADEGKYDGRERARSFYVRDCFLFGWGWGWGWHLDGVRRVFIYNRNWIYFKRTKQRMCLCTNWLNKLNNFRKIERVFSFFFFNFRLGSHSTIIKTYMDSAYVFVDIDSFFFLP